MNASFKHRRIYEARSERKRIAFKIKRTRRRREKNVDSNHSASNDRALTLAICLRRPETSFGFSIKEFGYSESAAYRRYHALRLTKEISESQDMLESGTLSLTNASTFHSIMSGKDQETKRKALNDIQNKTSEEARNKLFDYVPEKSQGKTDEKKHVGKETYQIRVTLSACVMEKMKRMKARTTIYDTEALLDRVLDIALKETDLTQKRSRKSRPSKHQRHISASVKRSVYARARYRCEHPGCDEMNYLEFDLIRPIALGGQSNVENMRLVCRAHNQLYAKMMGVS